MQLGSRWQEQGASGAPLPLGGTVAAAYPKCVAAAIALLLAAGCSAPPERAVALATLARWEDRRLADTDSLVAMLTAQDAHVRRAAMRATGLIGREDVLPELIRGLADRSASVREAAATSLGWVGSPQAAAPLAKAALGSDRAVARAALEALGKVPNDGLAMLPAARRGSVALATRAWDSLRDQAARVPPDSLLAAIAVALERKETAIVWRALRCAEKLPDSTLVTLLAPLAQARDPQVRVHALRALAQQKTPAALAAVLACAEKERRFTAREEMRVQVALARALGKLANHLLRTGAPLAVDPDLARTAALLAAGSRDRQPHVARAMLDAMTACADGLPLPPAAVQRESLLPIWRLRLARAAETRLTVDEPAVRAAAIEAYGSLRGAAAVPRLETLAMSKEPQLAAAALAALGRCAEVGELPLLEKLAGTGEHPLVREAALQAAGSLARRARQRAQVEGGGIPAAAATAAVTTGVAHLLARAAQDTDFAVAATACSLLGEAGNPAAAAALCQAFTNALARREGREDVQVGALEGLQEIGEQLPDSLRARVAAVCELAFDTADLRVRLQGRATALATQALVAALIPSESSLRATLPAAPRSPRQPPLCAPFDAPRLRCRTSRGEFSFELDGRSAPNTAAAILALAREGFYTDLTFHRVVSDFVVQGGDPRGDGWGGPGFALRCEYSRLPFDRGVIGIAHSGKDTGGSQFFICLSPQPHLNGRYTVAGRVRHGLEVVDSIQPGDTFTLEVLEPRAGQ